MEFRPYEKENTNSKWIVSGLGALALGGAAWYFWQSSGLKARYEMTTEEMVEISDGFRKELFDYHLMFYQLARDYILMREEGGRPVVQRPHMTTEEISIYLENSSLAKEYATKRLEIIRRIKPNLNLNQFLKKSDEIVKTHQKLIQNNQPVPQEIETFHRSFYFEAVFLDGQTTAINYLPLNDTPQILDHRAALQIFLNHIFNSFKEICDFFEENKNNVDFEQKKTNLKILCKSQSRFLGMKEEATEFVGGQAVVDTLAEDIRLYVFQLAFQISAEFRDKYNINDVNKLNNSFSSVCFSLVGAILKKEHSEFFFNNVKERIQILTEECLRFELETRNDFNFQNQGG